MKSLTEQQLSDLLKEAWEDGGFTYVDEITIFANPANPTPQVLLEREELFTKLIASV